MDTIGTTPFPEGLTVTKAIAMWQAVNHAGKAPVETAKPEAELFGAGELHGVSPLRYRRPRAPKPRMER